MSLDPSSNIDHEPLLSPHCYLYSRPAVLGFARGQATTSWRPLVYLIMGNSHLIVVSYPLQHLQTLAVSPHTLGALSKGPYVFPVPEFSGKNLTTTSEHLLY